MNTKAMLIAALAATSCYIQPTDRIPVGEHPKGTSFTNIRIDEDFTPMEADAIKQAISEWRVSIDQMFYFSWYTGAVDGETIYSVLKAGKGGEQVPVMPPLSGQAPHNLLGWVDGTESRIVLFTDNIDGYIHTMVDYKISYKHAVTKTVMLHELGHYMGLKHVNNPGALMHRYHGINCVSKYDIAQFCDLYDCTNYHVAPSCGDAWDPEIEAGLLPEDYDSDVEACDKE